MNVSDKELKELTDTFQAAHPSKYRTPRGVFEALLEKYPQATHFDHAIGQKKDGSLTLIHLPIDADGVVCGGGLNNTNPCPPLCD